MNVQNLTQHASAYAETTHNGSPSKNRTPVYCLAIDGALTAHPSSLVSTLESIELAITVGADHTQVLTRVVGSVPIDVIENEYQRLSVVLFLAFAYGAAMRLVFKDISPHPVTLVGTVVALACF